MARGIRIFLDDIRKENCCSLTKCFSQEESSFFVKRSFQQSYATSWELFKTFHSVGIRKCFSCSRLSVIPLDLKSWLQNAVDSQTGDWQQKHQYLFALTDWLLDGQMFAFCFVSRIHLLHLVCLMLIAWDTSKNAQSPQMQAEPVYWHRPVIFLDKKPGKCNNRHVLSNELQLSLQPWLPTLAHQLPASNKADRQIGLSLMRIPILVNSLE